MNDKPSTPSVALHACIGFVLGFAAEYVYLNLHPIERLAAETDGVPAWSVWQLPFAVPGGLAGAILGAAIAVLRRMLLARRRNSSAAPWVP